MGSRLREELHGVIPEVVLEVEPCPVTGRALNRAGSGEFRVRVVEDGAAPAVSCDAVAARLAGSPVVTSTVAMPPHVYLTVDGAALSTAVTTAILGGDGGYLEEQWGAGLHTLVAFSNPNYNKPLHLGHLRNNVLGAALAGLIESRGFRVTRAAIVSDFGRHICQAAVAYRRWGNDRTPLDTGEKPDHLVGRFYTLFHEAVGTDPSLAEEVAVLLRSLESGTAPDGGIHDLVVEWGATGIARTHARLGSRFDVIFREGATREIGRDLVAAAVTSGLCRRREDGSVFVDLSDHGIGEVTLLRRDGTSVVYTQLLGLNVARTASVPCDVSIAVNGRQWTEGHRILDTLLEAFGYRQARWHEHLHYGMVRSDNRTLRSREGEVLTIDELLDTSSARMADMLAERSLGVGPEVVEMLAVGLVKHCFLRVRPDKDLDFDIAGLWGDVYADYRLVVNTLREVEARARLVPRAAHGGGLSHALDPGVRTLLLHLDAAPRTVDDAALRRSPDEVLRFVRRLCTDLQDSQRSIPDDSLLWPCLARVMRRCFTLVNIDLPEELPLLPAALPRLAHERNVAMT